MLQAVLLGSEKWMTVLWPIQIIAWSIHESCYYLRVHFSGQILGWFLVQLLVRFMTYFLDLDTLLQSLNNFIWVRPRFFVRVGHETIHLVEKFVLERFDQFLTQKNEMFEEVVHKSDDDMILWKKCLFPLDTNMVHAQLAQKIFDSF